MKRICAWCTKDMGNTQETGTSDDMITHAICSPCEERITSTTPGEQIKTFLNQFNLPILVLDKEGRACSANEKALNAVHKTVDQVFGSLSGDVINCVFSKLPGGCGQTSHCASCAIRGALNETVKTGGPIQNRTAIQTLQTQDGTRKIKFVFSTEQVNDVTLLKIHEAAEIPAEPKTEAQPE